MFRGRHLLHHRCRVQAPVALSIGEAELYAQIRGLQETVSLKCLMEELRPAEGCTLECIEEVDSTACKGIMLRHGVGQLNHLATRTMRTQQILQREAIQVRRISRTVKSTFCLASHNSFPDLFRGAVQMAGMWLGAQLDEFAVFFAVQFSSENRRQNELISATDVRRDKFLSDAREPLGHLCVGEC